MYPVDGLTKAVMSSARPAASPVFGRVLVDVERDSVFVAITTEIYSPTSPNYPVSYSTLCGLDVPFYHGQLFWKWLL